MWDANVGTTTRILDAAEAAGDAADRLRLDRQRRSATPTAGSSTRRTGATSPTGFLSWYDETKFGAHEVAEQRIAAARRSLIAMPRHGLSVPATTPRSGAQLKQRPGAARCRTSALDRLGHRRRSTSTTRRRGSSPPSIAAGSAARTSSPATASGSSTTPSRSRPGSAARSCPRLRIPNGVLRAMAPFGRLIGEPNAARDRAVVGRRDLLGELAARQGRAGLRPARPGDGDPRHVRDRLTTLDPMARELPMFQPPGAAAHHPIAAPETIAMGGSVDPAPAPPRLDQGPDAVGRELPRPQGPAPRPEPQHGLRGGPLPEHRGVLGPADRDDHDPRRHVHPGLRLLRREDRPADVVRRRRAAAGRRGGLRSCGLEHVVVTSVARDDLPDGGAADLRRDDPARCAKRAPGWASRS